MRYVFHPICKKAGLYALNINQNKGNKIAGGTLLQQPIFYFLMKTSFTSLLVMAGLCCLTVFANSCAKEDTSADLPKEQQVVGKWVINRIQLKIFVNGTFIKDTILKPKPKPENFVKFDAAGGFEYRFNTPVSDIGTYEFAGAGALATNSSPKSYNWTMLTLTDVLFTVVSKGPDPDFPGAFVERYQTFTR
jgi:hypothetical protein